MGNAFRADALVTVALTLRQCSSYPIPHALRTAARASPLVAQAQVDAPASMPVCSAVPLAHLQVY